MGARWWGWITARAIYSIRELMDWLVLQKETMLQATSTTCLVLVLLLGLRRVGAIVKANLTTTELLAIGGLLHAPSLVNPTVSVTLSVALNIVLIMRLQEVHNEAARIRSIVLKEIADSQPPTTAEQRQAWTARASASPTADARGGRSGTKTRGSSAGETPTQSWVSVPQLSDIELGQLSSGEMVLKTLASQSGLGNEGMAAQRIDAPADLIWATLLDFNEWPRMVDDVIAARVYEREGSSVTKVQVAIGVGFLKINTYVHHVLDQAAGALTWTLDDQKSSDLLKNTGYWIVREFTGPGGGCVVYYSCNVQLRAWAPGWLDRYIAREGLPRALGWLKREAESRNANRSQPSFMGRRSLSSPALSDLDVTARNAAPQLPTEQAAAKRLQSPSLGAARGPSVRHGGAYPRPQHRRSGTLNNNSGRRLISATSWLD